MIKLGLKTTSLRAKFLLVILGLVGAITLSAIVDWLTGSYLSRIGYIKAMVPDTTEVYETSEFKAIAKISSQGLRNEPVVIPKPKDSYRVLALGDSFTFGWGVDLTDSWPKLLQKDLKKLNKQVEVINAGMPGASTATVSKICQAYKNQFDPDLLIYGLYGDDFYQAAEEEMKQKNQLKEWIARIWPNLSNIREPIIGSFRWVNLEKGQTILSKEDNKKEAVSLLKKYPGLILKINPKLKSDFLAGLITPAVLINGINSPDSTIYLLDKELLSQMLTILNNRLDELKKDCSGDKPLLVVFIPQPELVSGEYLLFKKELGFNVDPQLITLDIDTRLSNIATKNGFDYFSPLNNFRADGCPNCYYPLDGHLNTQGQQKLTEILLPWVQKKVSDLK